MRHKLGSSLQDVYLQDNGNLCLHVPLVFTSSSPNQRTLGTCLAFDCILSEEHFFFKREKEKWVECCMSLVHEHAVVTINRI